MKEPDEAPKKGRKKKTEDAKEHKKNWRETYATVEEIKAFLADHIFLRHNVITGRVECRIPSSYTSEGTRDWEPISDRIVNSLWVELSREKSVRAQDVYRVLESDFVPDFHPFRSYLDHLPPWDGVSDYILEMSVSVNVKGDVEEQMRFCQYLKKWLGDMLPADVLKKVNELLERVHRKDKDHQGSTVINIYEKGSMHIDRVDKQIFYGDACPRPTQPQEDKAPPTLPPPLSSPEAMALWQKAQRAGYVDEHYQPLLSRTQSALLADAMAERLGIKEKWKVFEALWNRKNMYKDLYYALNQKQSLEFQDKLKAIL